jgi:hypothetical protein
MKAFSFLLLTLAIILCGCGAGNTEQTRTRVSDYNVFGTDETSTQSSNSQNTQESTISSTKSYVGSWKMVSNNTGWPVGEILTINADGSYSGSTTGSGNCIIPGSSNIKLFGGIEVTPNISGSTMICDCVLTDYYVTYTRN